MEKIRVGMLKSNSLFYINKICNLWYIKMCVNFKCLKLDIIFIYWDIYMEI